MKRTIAYILLFFALLPVGFAAATGPSAVLLKARTIVPVAGTDALDLAIQEGAQSRHFFVQLERFAGPTVREELAGRGVALLEYIPNDTWIASFTREAMLDTDLRTRLVWVGGIDPRDKIPARWQSGRFGDWAIEPDGRIEMRVRLHADADLETAAALLENIGAELIAPFSLFKGYTIVASESTVPLIAALDEVSWVSEGLPEPATQNDQVRIMTNAELLQEAPYDLDGFMVFVGIWDGGLVDENHDDLAGRVIQSESGNVISHATHVAGTVGGTGLLSETHGGTPLQWRGMAPDAILFSWNFYGDVPQEILDGVFAYQLDLETNSWAWGVNGGNCSLYGDYDYWAPEFDAITRGAGGRTLNVMFAAANERDDGDCTLIEGAYACIPPPGTAKNVITIGATNSDDDTMTDFSSWGPVDDGRLKPDVSAPGCQHFGEGAVRSTEPGDTYSLKCGTSMATPTVTGNLALLYQLYNEENDAADPEPTMMKALLVATAVDLGNPGPDYAFGHGRIDAKAAADAMLNDTQVVVPVSNGESHEFQFPVPDGLSILRIALVWDDPPANPMANPALVNNLDLVLIEPDGTLHYPWIVNPSSPSQNATRGVDNLNNVEHVQVDDPVPGLWSARITGTNVPEGPQTASIVGFDVKAPGAPIDFQVAGSDDTSIDLTWTNALDEDREGTLIARWEGLSTWLGPYPGATYEVGEIVAPGVEIIYIADEDHSSTPLIDTGLTPGHTYHYLAFTFDDMHNYSAAASASGTAGDPAATEDAATIEATLSLGAARPNPAHSQMGFSFSLPEDAFVQVRFYDAGGRAVRTLVDAAMSAGTYAATWDGRDDAGRPVAPGVYFCELRANSERLSRQVSWTR